MTGLIRAVASSVLALVLTGCGAALPPPPDPTPPMPAVATPAGAVVEPTTPPPIGTTKVPRLVGRTIAQARTELGAAGLAAAGEQDGGAGYACVPADVVIFQRPSPGREVPLGKKVLAVTNGPAFGTCGLGLPPAPPRLRRAAREFAGFARAPSRDRRALSDHPIDLYADGGYARTLAVDQQATASSWDLCPAGVACAARIYLVSVVDAIDGYPGRLAVTTRAPAHPCAHPVPLPAALDGYERVTLTPDESRDCTSYFAVQLLVGDDGQVAAVDLVLSEP